MEQTEFISALGSMETDRAQTSFCAICKRRSKVVANPTNPNFAEIQSVYLGTFEQIRRKQSCPGCQSIISCFRGLEWNSTVVFHSYMANGGGCEIGGLRLMPTSSTSSKVAHGIPYDHRLINVPRLQSWLNTCVNSHGISCNQSVVTGLRRSINTIMLIDVEMNCLITASVGVKYAALSYVWGGPGVVMLQTSKNNLASLLRPGSLSTDSALGSVPKTVRDAMSLVRALKVKYLWVDCLCIVQDDNESKQKHLRSMGLIYAHSFFTIIAAGAGNANQGIPGTNVPDPDRCPPYRNSVGVLVIVLTLPNSLSF